MKLTCGTFMMPAAKACSMQIERVIFQYVNVKLYNQDLKVDYRRIVGGTLGLTIYFTI